jgi:hypothetical protein
MDDLNCRVRKIERINSQSYFPDSKNALIIRKIHDPHPHKSLRSSSVVRTSAKPPRLRAYAQKFK